MWVQPAPRHGGIRSASLSGSRRALETSHLVKSPGRNKKQEMNPADVCFKLTALSKAPRIPPDTESNQRIKHQIASTGCQDTVPLSRSWKYNPKVAPHRRLGMPEPNTASRASFTFIQRVRWHFSSSFTQSPKWEILWNLAGACVRSSTSELLVDWEGYSCSGFTLRWSFQAFSKSIFPADKFTYWTKVVQSCRLLVRCVEDSEVRGDGGRRRQLCSHCHH